MSGILEEAGMQHLYKLVEDIRPPTRSLNWYHAEVHQRRFLELQQPIRLERQHQFHLQ